MKTCLSVLALAVAFSPSLLADVSSSGSPGSAVRASVKQCAQCGYAPCRCGFSPSYYTHYRKPLPQVTCRRPVTPHWTHPQKSRSPVVPSRVARGAVVRTSPRVAHVIPQLASRSRLGYVPSSYRFTTFHRGYWGNNSLVQTPRRARVVPAPTPRQSLGYVPQGSWSQRFSTRHVRRCR